MNARTQYLTFLKDVFLCSLGAYGGPEAHTGVFLNRLVQKGRYLTEDELIELVALCSVLPGPTSTQTIVAVGHRRGGPLLALLTLLVWALPAVAAMGAFSFLPGLLPDSGASRDILRYLGPMAIGFIIVAALRIGRKVLHGPLSAAVLILSALCTYFFSYPWVFPLVLLAGGLASVVAGREQVLLNTVRLSPPWRYLVLFILFAAGSLAAEFLTGNRFAILFESFYRFGYLVYGGGQVVVPIMQGELVELRGYMNSAEFLAGYGLVQGLPGPMFSFAAYAGGLAARDLGTLGQILGAALGGIGIFLPGVLLIFFIYPVWEGLKGITAVRLSLSGINAAAAGMLVAAVFRLLPATGSRPDAIAAVVLTAVVLRFTKIPPTVLVLLSLGAGIVVY